MMHTIYKYLLASAFLASLVAFPACNVLDQEPADLIPTSEAIVDAQSAQAALNGVYDALQDGELYGGRFIMANEMVAGNGKAAAFQQFWQELQTGRVPTTNFHVEDSWIDFYAAINAANAILANVPPLTDLSDAQKEEMLGTAYFVRGLMFFDLLRQHGEFYDPSSTYGIPLKLEPSLSISETPRSTVSQSFEQIEQDLTEAIDLLEDQGNKFYASRGAAQALLARVYLYQEEYSEAAALATAVINNANYSLLDDYNEVYLTEGSAEAVFELNFITLNDPNVWSIEMYISPPEVAVSDDLVEFLGSRNELERGLYFEEIDGEIRTTKYGDQPQDDGENTIVIRLSEMYLIRAEALGRIGAPADALPDINTVRTRAGLSALVPADLGSQEDLTEVLIGERRAEFAFEGHYWFDLVRYGLMEPTLDLESFRRIFPIPQREMNITTVLEQNPGY